jgi:hypothetical protein
MQLSFVETYKMMLYRRMRSMLSTHEHASPPESMQGFSLAAVATASCLAASHAARLAPFFALSTTGASQAMMT